MSDSAAWIDILTTTVLCVILMCNRRIPVKHIGVVTDKVATVLDTVTRLREAKKSVEVHHHTAHPPQASAASRLLTTARLYGHTFLAAVPPLAQSVVLGTAVFSVYEEVKQRSDEFYGVHSGLVLECKDPYHFARTLGSSTTAGGLAGTLHGVLFTAWQHGEGIVRGNKYVPTRLPGTMAAHSVAHATLFGVFEAVKHSLFVVTETDHSSVKGMAAVATAGAIAGQFLTHVTDGHLAHVVSFLVVTRRSCGVQA